MEAREAGANGATRHQGLLDWVDAFTALTRPSAVRWCTGSEAERAELEGELVEAGTLIRLDPQRRPRSFLARSDPRDVARVESRTFVCSEARDDAGPTNNWADPAEMRARLDVLFDGCMRGRTLYVVPFCMGPLDSEHRVIGVELTDSAYVVLSMRMMARMGRPALDALGEDGFFVRCLHTLGAPLAPGDADVPWPCSEEKWIVHYPETREIWSYGSGYGGNALLGKKCLALRIASAMARDEGWLAEHMLILKLTDPEGEAHFVAAAFPSACGKTNLAMLDPALAGWSAETVGDDIAWLRFGRDGRLYAVNPEAGFFGVAPGTSPTTNRHAVAMLDRGALFTNAALTPDGDVWWEGLTRDPPDSAVDWRGREWSPGDGTPAAHPNARFTIPAEACPTMAPEWREPSGVPISAILFGGRRAGVVPLVAEAFDWEHGVYMAANMASEGTAAAENAVGDLRRDPFAMLPFCGYNMADYFTHWLRLGAAASSDPAVLPRIFMVNWFRKGDDGRYLWPGFGDNVRVLKWVVERLQDRAEAHRTAIGLVPAEGAVDLSGLVLRDGAERTLLAVDAEEWLAEAASNRSFLEGLGERVPPGLMRQQVALEARLGTAAAPTT